ncbi:unnamed protein product [Symbiodinium microadriaticum]|nr:unnamed protein product [Symbiodinium microadriaticum]
MKRSAIKKNALWKKLPYIRDADGMAPRGTRTDQIKWKRSLPELLQASDQSLVKKLIADKILPNLKGKTCPRCTAGKLSGLTQYRGSYKHRCNNRACHVWINPHHLHPLFTEGTGNSTTRRLQIQAGMLLLKLLHVSHPVIHIALDVNHKAIEDLEKRLCELRLQHVEKNEKKIVFGDGKSWKDVEAEIFRASSIFLYT